MTLDIGVDGDSNYVPIQVLTNSGALERRKQLAVVERLTNIAADAPRWPAGRGCCSVRRPTEAGASMATRTPTTNWWLPPRRS